MRFAGRNIYAGVTTAYLAFGICTLALTAFALDPQKKITQFAHRSWGAADGLDQVYSIAQTADGYIWIGAANGLFRFDGFHFKQWEPEPREPRLPGHASLLLGAKNGSLWIASVGHMLRLEQGKMTDFPLLGAPPGTVMYKLQEARDGTLWVATSLGLLKFAQGQWQKVDLPCNFSQPLVSALLIDSGGTVWAGVINWDKPDECRLLFLRPGESHFRTIFEPIDALLDMAESGNRQVWLSRTGVSLASPRVLQNDGPLPYLLDGNIRLSSYRLHFDHHGNLWATSHGVGLSKLDPASVHITNSLVQASGDLNDHFSRQDGLSSDYPNCIFEDREGNIWVGTTAGLDCFSETKISALSSREGLPYDSNLSIQATPEGTIWAVSTPGGFEKIDPKGQPTAKAWSGLTPGGLAAGYCLYADKGGDLIAGTGIRLGLIRHDDLSDFTLPGGAEFKTVTAITRDGADGLWLCDHDQGMLRLLDNKLERFPQLKQAPLEYAITAHTDSMGRVWFGYAYGGIARYDKAQIVRFTSKDGLFSGQVRTIFSDDAGRVWAAGDSGLSRFENGLFRTLKRENGLPDDDVYAVLEDNDQCFWIAGVHGLFRVTRAKLEMALSGGIRAAEGELFEANDGIRGIVHHAPTGTPGLCYTVATKSPDGKLWFSTSAGLAIVDPRHIPKNQIPPVVHIEQIISSKKAYQKSENLQLPKGTRDCEIDYVGLSFWNPAKVRYRYKLEGYDKDWVDAGSRRQAFYSNLRPRAYRFRVRACNNDGVWSEKDEEIGFVLAPEFYEATWFPPLCVASVTLVLFGLHRLRLARLAARMNLQLAIQQNERKRIAQELHDTLLQGFTGVGLKLDALVSSLPASLKATKEQFKKTLELTDQYLTEGRRSVWKLRSPALENTEGFSRALEKASQRALAGTPTALRFSVHGEETGLRPVIEDNLLRICEEAVANAVKHARPTQVEVTLEFNSKNVQLSIRDNGCGFDEKQIAKSKEGHFGLVGIQERVKGMGGKYALHSQPGKGTEVAVTVRIE